MRNHQIILIVCMLMTLASRAADKAINLSGTWVIDPAQNRPGWTRFICKPSRPRISPREASPGIGWPRGTGPDGYPVPPSRSGIVGLPVVETRDLTLVINQRDEEVQITRRFKDINLKAQEIIQKFALDGSQNSNPASNGHGVFLSTSAWKNGELVNLGRQIDGNYKMIVKEEYSISKNGKRLTIKTSGYYRADGNAAPNALTKAARRADVIFKQVFSRH